MKNTIYKTKFRNHSFTVVIALIFSYVNVQSQNASCCMMSSTQQFAMLGNDQSFVASHLSPIPFHYNPVNGKMITFNTPDGKTGNAYEVKSSKPGDKYIILIHEWWGLNDYIKKEAERFYDELGDVTILAIDLYDGKVADVPEKAQEYVKSVTDERANSIIKGVISYAGSKAKIQTIGWCFGGGWSLQAALQAGKQLSGCVMYYGMPEKKVERLKTLNAPVFGIFGNKDKYITPEIVDQFDKDMKAAGKQLTLKKYDADHGFANPSNPHYEKVMAEDAHSNALAFFKKNFK